jgi:hypothetical protein
MDSNHRRLSRRFYRPLPFIAGRRCDLRFQRLCAHLRPVWSVMRPCRGLRLGVGRTTGGADLLRVRYGDLSMHTNHGQTRTVLGCRLGQPASRSSAARARAAALARTACLRARTGRRRPSTPCFG